MSVCCIYGEGNGEIAYIACFSELFIFPDHSFKHGIFDITELKRSSVFRDINSIENMRSATVNASARSFQGVIGDDLPSIRFLGGVVIVYLTWSIDIRRTLSAADNRRSSDGMIRVPEVYSLISGGNRNKSRC